MDEVRGEHPLAHSGDFALGVGRVENLADTLELVRESARLPRGRERWALAASRGEVVDSLRRLVKKRVDSACENASLRETTSRRATAAPCSRQSITLAQSLYLLSPDAHAQLLLGNAYLAASKSSLAAATYLDLQTTATSRKWRQIATHSFGLALSLMFRNGLAIPIHRSLVDSPFEVVAQSSAISLVIQAARAPDLPALAYGLDALNSYDSSWATRIAPLLRRYHSLEQEVGHGGAIEESLAQAGTLGTEVLEHWRQMP